MSVSQDLNNLIHGSSICWAPLDYECANTHVYKHTHVHTYSCTYNYCIIHPIIQGYNSFNFTTAINKLY